MPAATQSSAVVKVEQEPRAIEVIKTELEKRGQDLLKVLPPGMDAERFMRVSLIAVSKNPDILKCTPSSIIRSIVEAAEIGLEPTGSLNRAWLVPFKNKDTKKDEAQLMIGYQGYADLMRDSGKVTRVVAECVYEGDQFRVVKGTEEPRIEHEPAYATEDPSKITYVYGIVWFADGTFQFEVMTHAQIEAIRAKSKQANGATWTQGWPQMARKTLIRRLSNYVPLTARAVEAIARDDEREYGAANAVATVSRTLEVRKALAERTGRGKAPALSAGEAENPAQEPAKADPGTSTPKKSAEQQTSDPAPAEAGDGGGGQLTIEGSTREVCGERLVPVKGDVLVCDLEAGHEGSHTTKDGKKWSPGAKA